MDKAVIEKTYRRKAKTYDTKWSKFCDSCWKHIEPALHDITGKWILDAGCGTGLITNKIASATGNWGQVVGVDLSPEMIEKARARMLDQKNVTIHKAPITAIPSRDRSFDIAVSTNVLHHVEDLTPAIKEMRRVLNSSGEAILIDYERSSIRNSIAKRWWSVTDPSFKKTWKRQEVEKILCENGFSIIESKKVKCGHFPMWMIHAKKE